MALSSDGAHAIAPFTLAVPAGASDTVVKAKPGAVGTIVVTATGTTPLQVYDNATTGSGTIIAALPASPAIGAYPFNIAAQNGITVKGSASNPAVLVSFW